MITDGFTYVAILLFMAGVLVTLEKTAKGGLQTFFKYVPSVVLCYLIAMLMCTLKVWDLGQTKAAYSALKNNLTYAMVFAMLLMCDIRKVLRLGPRMLLGFFSATLTIMLGFIAAFLIMKRFIGSDAWMGLGALCGSWIGGSGNMVAVQAALNIGEADMGYALVIDSIDYSLWVMFLLWAVQLAPRESWVTFFRDCRLAPQFKRAQHWFDTDMRRRVIRLLDHLDDWLVEPPRPSLLHGDLWSGNFITGSDGQAWLIDPAVYVGHAEADLAMTELFGVFHPRFYAAYQEVNPFQAGYAERRDMYNLYHLLNHLNLFGGGYLSSVDRILRRYT